MQFLQVSELCFALCCINFHCYTLWSFDLSTKLCSSLITCWGASAGCYCCGAGLTTGALGRRVWFLLQCLFRITFQAPKGEMSSGFLPPVCYKNIFDCKWWSCASVLFGLVSLMCYRSFSHWAAVRFKRGVYVYPVQTALLVRKVYSNMLLCFPW